MCEELSGETFGSPKLEETQRGREEIRICTPARRCYREYISTSYFIAGARTGQRGMQAKNIRRDKTGIRCRNELSFSGRASFFTSWKCLASIGAGIDYVSYCGARLLGRKFIPSIDDILGQHFTHTSIKARRGCVGPCLY